MPVWQLLLGVGVAVWLIFQMIRDRHTSRQRRKVEGPDQAENRSVEGDPR